MKHILCKISLAVAIVIFVFPLLVCASKSCYSPEITLVEGETETKLYTLQKGLLHITATAPYDGSVVMVSAIYSGQKMLSCSCVEAENLKYEAALAVQSSSNVLKIFFLETKETLKPTESVFCLPDNERVLETMQSLFSDYFVYLANQYDPLTGGIYATKSYAADPAKSPDIQSSAQFVGGLKFGGILEDMPETIRLKMVSYFQNCQDPETGYFIDNEKTAASSREKGRALDFAVNSLHLLGAEPLYLLPAQRMQLAESGALQTLALEEDYLQSPTAFQGWIENLEWDTNAWGAGDKLVAAVDLLNGMNETDKMQYLNVVWDYCSKHQNAQTGLWGGGGWFREVSGAFKIGTIYKNNQRLLPNADKMYESTLYCMRNDSYVNMCFVRNPVDLLTVLRLQPDIKSRINADLCDIIGLTCDNLQLFQQPDGGFSYSIGKADFSGLDESDLNACANARLACQYVYQLCSLGIPDFSSYTRNVYNIMQKKQNATDYYDNNLNSVH